MLTGREGGNSPEVIRNCTLLCVSTSLLGCGHFVERGFVLNSDSAEDALLSAFIFVVEACITHHQLYYLGNGFSKTIGGEWHMPLISCLGDRSR